MAVWQEAVAMPHAQWAVPWSSCCHSHNTKWCGGSAFLPHEIHKSFFHAKSSPFRQSTTRVALPLPLSCYFSAMDGLPLGLQLSLWCSFGQRIMVLQSDPWSQATLKRRIWQRALGIIHSLFHEVLAFHNSSIICPSVSPKTNARPQAPP